MYTLLTTFYVLFPKIMTLAFAEDYNPFAGCKPEDINNCSSAAPKWLGFTKIFQYAENWITKLSADCTLAVLKIGSINIFEKVGADYKYAGVGAIVEFFKHFSFIMLAFGIMMAIMETAIAYMNGQGNAGATAVNVGKSIVFKAVAIDLSIQIFNNVLNICNQLAVLIVGAGVDSLTGNAWADLAIKVSGLLVGSGIISAIVFIIIDIAEVKFIWALARRAVVFLTLLAEGSLLPLSIARGYAGEMQSYLKKIMLFFVGCILQMTFFFIGLEMVKTALSNVTIFWEASGPFVTGFAFMFCSEKVFGYLGTVGEAGNGSMAGAIGSVMHIADHAKGIVGIATGNPALVAGSASSMVSSAAK